MAKVARPSAKARPVDMLSWADMEKCLAACTGKTEAETARNRAILWLFLEFGLRRFELAALKLSDVDRSARTAFVRDGKGHKARTACYGVGTAQALRKWLRYRGRDEGPCSPRSWARASPPRASASWSSGSARPSG
jgi:site-specific recombinase XerD